MATLVATLYSLRDVLMDAHTPSPQSAGCIMAGTWGAGLPSFWCAELPQATRPLDVRQFLVREEHAAQFATQFSGCTGANILSAGPTTTKATREAKLVVVEPPPGYVRNTQATRPQRFVNERVRLTQAGASDLARGARKNQIVWGFRYRCDGIDTYVCVCETTLRASADEATQSIGRAITAGTTVVARETKQLLGQAHPPTQSRRPCSVCASCGSSSETPRCSPASRRCPTNSSQPTNGVPYTHNYATCHTGASQSA